MDSADVADVTFGIKHNGKVLLGGIAGKAVRENGTWKVADTTFCTLLKLEGTAPACATTPASSRCPPDSRARVRTDVVLARTSQRSALATVLVVLFLTFLDTTIVSVTLGSIKPTCLPE